MHAYFLLGGPADQVEAFKAELAKKKLVRTLELIEVVLQPEELRGFIADNAAYLTRTDLLNHPTAKRWREELGTDPFPPFAEGLGGDPTKRTFFVNLNPVGVKSDARLRFHTEGECYETDAL